MADVKRKTANLFSDKLIGMTWWDGVIVADERFTLHIAEVKPNTTYTASGNNSVDNIMVTYYSVYPAEGQSSVLPSRYVYPTDPTRSVATFTTPDDSRIKYAAVRFGSDATDVMFNLGSTAFPYEPYGWVHSLRKLTTSTDTITTLPADLYADGNNATVGLVGNMSQSGTPTPQNPIQPEETGERTGNLFDRNATDTNNGYESGVYLLSSGSTRSSVQYFISEYIGIKPEASYTLVYGATYYNAPSVCFYDSAKQYISGESYAQRLPMTFTTPPGTAYIRFSSQLSAKSIVMLNEGSTALSYEPYGYKIPILSASTTTPVYLGEVETTRYIEKRVLDGTENWTVGKAGTENEYYVTSGTAVIQGNGYSSHYIYRNITTSNTVEGMFVVSTGGVRVRDKSFSSVDDFKSFLAAQYAAGTPVCVWYVLATPETAVVNEPLRKIGDYADTVSGITIPTISGKDTFDVLTTLKPSEVSLAYTGWHDAQSVHEKSRNLFDKNTSPVTIYPSTPTISNSSNAISVIIPVEPNTAYTFSKTLGNRNRFCETESIPAQGNVALNYVNADDSNSYTITTGSTTHYILWWVGYQQTYSDIAASMMINTGSSALPYEPYWS